MPRELRTELQALIATGRFNAQTVVDIVLTDGTQLHLSSAEIFVNRFSITRQYLGKLPKESVRLLTLSQFEEVDEITFSVANVDNVMGEEFTGATRKFDGARATRGVLFVDPNDTNFSAGQHILDQNFPGELVATEVNEDEVPFSLVSDVDSVTVAGRTISSEFQWREPLSNVPVGDPIDVGPGVGPDGDPLDDPTRRRRYGDDRESLII